MPAGVRDVLKAERASETARLSAVEIATGDSLNIGRQLESLRELKDGWADGMQPAGQWGESYGKAPSPEGLDWLADQFSSRYAADLPQPYLYPMPEGGVQAEWSIDSNEASLEIDLAAHVAEWHCLDMRTARSNERVLDLDDRAAWKWLTLELRRLRTAAE